MDYFNTHLDIDQFKRRLIDIIIGQMTQIQLGLFDIGQIDVILLDIGQINADPFHSSLFSK